MTYPMDGAEKTRKPRCRCFINAKYYARQAFKGGQMKGYKPCQIHERQSKASR